MLNRTVVFLSLLRRHYIGITNTIALCHDRHNLQKYHGYLTLKTAKFHTNSDVYISHNCCCASLLCIFVFCRAVRYSFDHINRVLMEIWVKIKQLISILFCGYRRRLPIHYCRCKPKPIPTSYPGFSLCGRGLKRTLAKAVKIIHNLWIILSRGMYEQGGAFYRLLNVVSVC